MAPQAIGWINTGLPVAALMALAVVLPWLLAPRATLSHTALGLAVLATAVLLLAVGVGIFALAYRSSGADIGGAFAAYPLGTWLAFVRTSALATLAWGPLLALVWFTLAQGVERRRGEAAARRDAD